MSQVTQAELARALGVAKSTVTKYKKAGRIRFDAQGLIDLDTARAQILDSESLLPNHQALKAKFEEGKQEPAPQPATESATASGLISKEDATHRAKIAMMKEREWAAVQREIDARKAAGELVDVSKVRDAWRSAFVLLRASMEALPPRSAPALAVRRGEVAAIERDLADIITDLLNECAAAFDRKLDGQA
jgi:transcriptional regulator with XRE-family HTH domain